LGLLTVAKFDPEGAINEKSEAGNKSDYETTAEGRISKFFGGCLPV
jgi:hypothetical protein